MRPTEKDSVSKPESDPDRPGDYERFEAFARALVSVPKPEIQQEADEYDKAKEARRSA